MSDLALEVPPPPPHDESVSISRNRKRASRAWVSPQLGASKKPTIAFCRYFQAGCCWYDQDCQFVHESAGEDSDYKMTLCAEFVRSNRCPDGSDCRKAHGQDELRTPIAFLCAKGYKTSLCTWYLLDDTECDKEGYNCFDAHGMMDLRLAPLSVPPQLCDRSFTFSDAHIHLDQVLLARRYGSSWMHKRANCTHRPCNNTACMWAHGDADKRPRLMFDKGDLVALSEDFDLLIGGKFGGCVHSSCEVDTIEETVRLAQWGREVFDGRVYVCFGIHPTHYESWTPEVEVRLESAIRECGAQCVAWGECGLDYYRRDSTHNFESLRPQMVEAFAGQARAAVRLGLPLVVHSRAAEEDTLKVLSDNVPRNHPVYLHAASSSLDMIAKFLEGWTCSYVGIPGCVTYRFAVATHGIARAVPLDRLLLETDGPYMTPRPYYEPSHPGHIPWIAEGVAREKDIDVFEVLSAGHQNFTRFFRL